MANGNHLKTLVLIVLLHITTVVSEEESQGSNFNVGAIVAVSIVGAIIVIITLLLCFHECCTKPKKKVRPTRVSVLAMDQFRGNTVPPSRVVPSEPAHPPPGLCPTEPPPYDPYDYVTPSFGKPHISNTTTQFSRHLQPVQRTNFDRHPPPIMSNSPLPNFSRRPTTPSAPPPYSG